MRIPCALPTKENTMFDFILIAATLAFFGLGIASVFALDKV
jgi:hypothetical protein